MFLEEVPEKTFIITAKGASTYIGESVDFNDLRLYYLTNSKGQIKAMMNCFRR